MYISKIYIDGLLSFNNFNLELKKGTNIIVGPNGVGKSNFFEIIRHKTRVK